MEFKHIGPHNKKVEEEALFDLAGMICPENAGLLPDPEGFKKYVEPLLTGRRVHAEASDNFVAFSILGGLLKPTTGSWRFLPQCAPEWLAFRRLFLKICDVDIPVKLRRSPIRSGPEADSESYREFCREHNIPIKRRRKARPAPARIGSADERRILKGVVADRLANYEGVSLSQMKDDFVKNGRTSADSECGALYEVKQNLPWKLFPYEQDLESAIPEFSTARCVMRLAEKVKMRLDFADEYRKAVLSVRGVLFDLAVEETFGGRVSFDVPIHELESKLNMRLLVSDPLSIESDEKVRDFLIDGLAGMGRGGDGVKFARSVAATIVAARKKANASHHETIKKVVARYWLDPDFPLWLMTAKAIGEFLGAQNIKREKPGLKNVIYELSKERKKNPRSVFKGIPRGLITSFQKEAGGGPLVECVMTLEESLTASSPICRFRQWPVRD